MPSYRGQGAYSAPKSAAWGERAGEALGGVLGMIPQTKSFAAPIGALASKLGGFLGNKLGTYMGWGDYKVNMNSLLVPEGNSPAQMHSDGKTVRICHREYIGDVFSDDTPGEFNLKHYQINPANAGAFPWLWNIAVNFQKYKIHGAIVEFKSNSGDALTSSNTSLGTVICASNYNCADPNFQNRSQMENTQYTSSAKPSVSFVHIIECDPHLQTQTNLYTAPGGIPPTGVGINEVNWVNVQVATLGVQGSGVNLGALYITYDIELIQPINQVDGTVFRGDWFSLSGTSDQFAANALANRVPLAQNSLGGTIVSGDTYVFAPYIQSGLFRLSYFLEAGDPAPGFLSPYLELTNCTNTFDLPPGGRASEGAVSESSLTGTWTIRVDRAGATIHMLTSSTPAGQLIGSFCVDQIDADFDN